MLRLASLVPPPLRPLARRVRGLLRTPDRTPLDTVLAPADAQAVLVVSPGIVMLERGTSAAVTVSVL